MRYIIGDFDEDTVFLELIEAVERDRDNVLFFDIFSNGGRCDLAIALLGQLQKAKRRGKKIVTRNCGVALSSGAQLLVQGDVIYLVDTAVTMFHLASVEFDFSLQSLFTLIKDKIKKLFDKKRDFVSIMNNDFMFQPTEQILRLFKEKKFKGDYYLLPRDMVEILGDRVKIEDIPDELLNLSTFNKGEVTLNFYESEEEEDDEAFDYTEEISLLSDKEFSTLYDLVIKEHKERKQKSSKKGK